MRYFVCWSAVCKERGDMSRYRRFIAYVYEYVDGKKGNGKGFIKVEAKDGICRMQYKLSGICQNDPIPGKIYGYVRRENVCEGIFLGECNLSGGSIQFECEMPVDRMGESPYALEDICGLIILTDSGIMYGSGWDDKPIRLGEILLPKEAMRQEEEEEIAVEPDLEDEEMETAETEQAVQQEIIEEEENLEERAMESPIIQENFQEELPEPQMAEQSVKKSEESAVFRDHAFCDCRKINPGDFKMLNRRDQGLLYNNFLRHGFSRHGFVILARREEDDQYILGVPGYYERQEALMANMFGFPYFKEAGKDRNGTQGFGYWYRFIEQPNLE